VSIKGLRRYATIAMSDQPVCRQDPAHWFGRNLSLRAAEPMQSSGRKRHQSQTQFRMRSDADQPQCVDVGLLVDQHQARPDMAVAVIGPLAAQRMVVVPVLKWNILSRCFEDRHQAGI